MLLEAKGPLVLIGFFCYYLLVSKDLFGRNKSCSLTHLHRPWCWHHHSPCTLAWLQKNPTMKTQKPGGKKKGKSRGIIIQQQCLKFSFNSGKLRLKEMKTIELQQAKWVLALRKEHSTQHPCPKNGSTGPWGSSIFREHFQPSLDLVTATTAPRKSKFKCQISSFSDLWALFFQHSSRLTIMGQNSILTQKLFFFLLIFFFFLKFLSSFFKEKSSNLYLGSILPSFHWTY